MKKEKQLDVLINVIFHEIHDHLSYDGIFDDYDKAVIVKALINELNNDLVSYLCRIEFKKRGIEP